MVAIDNTTLRLNDLTSIDKEVAQELATHAGNYLELNGLISIDKEVAKELTKFGTGRVPGNEKYLALVGLEIQST